MRIVIIVFCFSAFAACSNNSAVSRKLSGSDSLVINFFEPNTTNITKTVATGEKKAVRRLSEFVSGKETEQFKCGYDGEMLFFEKGKQVSNVSFKFSNDSCRHFLLDVEGKLTATKMSDEATDFLRSLSRGDLIYW
jgi:hypothetical protein